MPTYIAVLKIAGAHCFLALINSTIPGGPEITEQSIQSIFQDFVLINSYFLHLVG